MKCITIITAMICMATTSPALTPDPGPHGLEWIDGLGFRPIDGVDTYGGGKWGCQGCVSRKNGATDSIETDAKAANYIAAAFGGSSVYRFKAQSKK